MNLSQASAALDAMTLRQPLLSSSLLPKKKAVFQVAEVAGDKHEGGG